MSGGGLPRTKREIDAWLEGEPAPVEVARLFDHLATDVLRRHLLREVPRGSMDLVERAVARPALAPALAENENVTPLYRQHLVRAAARWLEEARVDEDVERARRGLELARTLQTHGERLEHGDQMALFVATHALPDELLAIEDVGDAVEEVIGRLSVTRSAGSMAAATLELPTERGQQLLEELLHFNPAPVFDTYEAATDEQLAGLDLELLLPLLRTSDPTDRKRAIQLLDRVGRTPEAPKGRQR